MTTARRVSATGNDLEIYHDAADKASLTIEEPETCTDWGNNKCSFTNGNELKLKFVTERCRDERYHDNASKLPSTSAGIDVTGECPYGHLTLDNRFETTGSSLAATTSSSQYGGTNKSKLDSSGNLTVVGNVTAYGTI